MDGQSAEIVGRERSERTKSGANREGLEPRVVEQHDRQSQSIWRLEREADTTMETIISRLNDMMYRTNYCRN